VAAVIDNVDAVGYRLYLSAMETMVVGYFAYGSTKPGQKQQKTKGFASLLSVPRSLP